MSPRGAVLVVDTNVWISGMLTKTGAPALLVRQVVQAGQPAFSAATFAELRDRLWLPKFDRYVSMERRRALLVDLESIALHVDIPPAIAAQAYCRDTTDDKFVHAALAAQSAWLVTGDRDLLVLADALKPRGVQIVAPADWPGLP